MRLIFLIFNFTTQNSSREIGFYLIPLLINSLSKNNRKQVLATRADAEKDGVIVPLTLEEYCIKASSSKDNESNEDCILDDLDDLDLYDNNDDDSNSNYNESNTDSGNEET